MLECEVRSTVEHGGPERAPLIEKKQRCRGKWDRRYSHSIITFSNRDVPPIGHSANANSSKSK